LCYVTLEVLFLLGFGVSFCSLFILLSWYLSDWCLFCSSSVHMACLLFFLVGRWLNKFWHGFFFFPFRKVNHNFVKLATMIYIGIELEQKPFESKWSNLRRLMARVIHIHILRMLLSFVHNSYHWNEFNLPHSWLGRFVCLKKYVLHEKCLGSIDFFSQCSWETICFFQLVS